MRIWYDGLSDRELVARLVEDRLAEIRQYGKETSMIGIPPSVSAERAWYLLAAADEFARVVSEIRALFRAHVAERIGPGGAARFGDTLVRYSRTPDPVATEALEPFLRTLDVDDVLRILPKPTKFRKTGLVAVAEKHGIPEETLEGTFYVDRARDKDPTLTTMPVSNPRAPKYVAEMTDGEIRRKK